jgi:hypothetical protein
MPDFLFQETGKTTPVLAVSVIGRKKPGQVSHEGLITARAGKKAAALKVAEGHGTFRAFQRTRLGTILQFLMKKVLPGFSPGGFRNVGELNALFFRAARTEIPALRATIPELG